jgi:hypothetical protein
VNVLSDQTERSGAHWPREPKRTAPTAFGTRESSSATVDPDGVAPPAIQRMDLKVEQVTKVLLKPKTMGNRGFYAEVENGTFS